MLEFLIERYVEEQGKLKQFYAQELFHRIMQLSAEDCTAAIDLLDEITGEKLGNSWAYLKATAAGRHVRHL